MEEFLQIEGVDWDDIKSKEPNVEFEFISTNESMSPDNKPTLPDGSELPSESITGEFKNSRSTCSNCTHNKCKPNKKIGNYSV